MTDKQTDPTTQPTGGLLTRLFESFFRLILTGILRAFGLGRKVTRDTLEPIDQQYRAYVDSWVSARLADWLHDTRPEIDVATANEVLLTNEAHDTKTAQLIKETLIDAKVTFSQRDSKQYLEIEAYTAPIQKNGQAPQLLRWRAEREINWAEIPDAIRERLIRARQPVTLGYALPK